MKKKIQRVFVALVMAACAAPVVSAPAFAGKEERKAERREEKRERQDQRREQRRERQDLRTEQRTGGGGGGASGDFTLSTDELEGLLK